MDRDRYLNETNEVNSRNKVYLNLKLDSVKKRMLSFENISGEIEWSYEKPEPL